ncbi:MAG: hypothetical protein JRJ12_10430 [Deltaproteobacteria bacterium]|nr:hypothetical protein [Deltaproteobacteria bacterium]MBW2070699.1 hypothetical protein [Deltaproteobacteria bacterium]
MKLLKSLLLAGLLLLVSSVLYAQDYSGTWIGHVTESISHCKELGKAEVGEYRLTITQKGNEIIIMENVVQRPYTGVLNPQTPGEVHVQATYRSRGGYVSDLVDIKFTDENSGSGRGVWGWSDGWYQCGGSYQFTLQKKRP